MNTAVRVRVGSILHGYTGSRDEVRASGSTLGELLEDLDRQFPGLRFRLVDEQGNLRPHINAFVGGRSARDLGTPVRADSEVAILGSLSGG